jgi:acyl-coenzyme A synthetase/AMP-(fatty) acid ligase
LRLRKESSKRPVEETRRESPPELANLTVDLLKPVLHSKRYGITNVDSLGVIERFTYTEITRETARWAQLLREKGLQPGDRVVIVAGREWGWRCALLGAIHAGGVAVPCPASLSLREIHTVADQAGASLLVSLRPRPDLVELDGRRALTADDVDAVDPARALAQRPHQTESRDIALILYAWHGLDLTGTMHTHASLLAQADAGEHWLGVDGDERIWATADDGSGPSIWLLLAAWRRAASIVVVDLELDSEAKLELLDRLRPAAVWFSDDEYGMLGSSVVPPWVDLRSIRRALVDTEETEGASSFVAAFGAALVPVFALDELGVVAGWPAGHEGQADATTAHPTPGVQVAVVGGDGTELPPGEVGDVAVRSDAPTLFSGYAGREGRSRSAGWFRFGWRGALTAEGTLRIESRSPGEVEPVGASVDLPAPELADEPAPEEHVAAEPEPAALGWRARRERTRREEERAAEEERVRHDEAEALELAEREAAEAAERERAEAVERRDREEADRRERSEREAAAEARRAEDERLAEERRVAEQANQRDEEQRQRAEEDARRRADQEAKQRAAAEADERAEAEAKQRAEEEERRRAEEEAKAQQAVAAGEAKRRAEEEKSREKERQREEKEARARAEREAEEREKAEAEERRRAEEEAKIQAKREDAEAKQRAKEEKEREQREARERVEREKAEAEAAKVQAKVDAAEAKRRAKEEKERAKREARERVERERAEAEAAKVQAKVDAAEAKQRAKEEKEREKREAVERAEREKAEAEAAKVQAKVDAAEAKQRAKDDKEREKREAVERAEREKAEAEAAKARQKQAEVDAKQRAEEEKRSAKEREREAKEARRRAEEEAKEAARAERKASRKQKRRPQEAPKPADDGPRRFGRRRREVVEETEPQRAPDVVARIQQYGMAATSNDSPAEPPEQADDD